MTDLPQAAIDAAVKANVANWPHETIRAQVNAILEAAAPYLAAAERERIRRYLLDGDPCRLEKAFRAIVDDEEAADCALIVADLLRDPTPPEGDPR